MTWKVGDQIEYLNRGSRLFTKGWSYIVTEVEYEGEAVMLTIVDDTATKRKILAHVNKPLINFKKVAPSEGIEEYSPVRPAHYHEGGIDVFALIEANWEMGQVAGFYAGNVLKYVLRYKKKNGVEDLKKAMVNLEQLIKWEEGSDGKED